MHFILLLLPFCLLGVFAGLLSGLLGVGGGLIIVPGLVFLFQMEHIPNTVLMHMALGTSLATIVITSLRSLQAHVRFKIQFWHIFRLLLPGVIVGTVGGAILAHYLHPTTLTLIFAIFILIASVKTFFENENKTDYQLPGSIVMSLVGLFIGVSSGLLGIGGGALTIPFLTYCNVSIRNAFVVSAATGVTVSIIGTISYMISGWHAADLPMWSTGYVYWPGFLPVALVSVLFAPLGARLSHSLSVTALKYIFAVFLFLIGIHMLWLVWS